MSDFKSLQSRHEELIRKAQANQEVLDQAQKLIEDIKKGSSQISSTSERDQLRANLRYWASYIYEKSGNYPIIDLAPSTIQQRLGLVTGSTVFSILGILALLAFLFLGGYLLFNNSSSQQAGATHFAQATQQQATIKAGLMALTLQSRTLTAAATSTPFLINPPTLVEATQAGAISIEITSVHEGDEVSPITELSGTYSNLPTGSSIHVIIQPLSKGGLQFPMKQFATVSPNSSTGTWVIEGRFGQGEDLKVKEEYRIYVVAAIDEVARQTLFEASETGFQKLPSGVIPFPQTVKVSRAAYADFIDGVRLVYSSFLDDEANYEIFTAQIDGSDIRRITYSSGIDELFASLSPDGTKIVYVGQRRDENKNLVYSVDVMNSDGTAVSTIVQIQDRRVYEKPLWSTDGRYVAYSVGRLQSNGSTYWNIYVYDFQNEQNTMITKGDTTSNRYFSWIPGKYEIVFDARMAETGTSGFVLMDILNPDEESLYFDSKKEEVQPAVSPDGKFLAYMQLDGRTGNIYVVDLTTKAVTQLTYGEFQDLYPVWTPDGKAIFFDSAETPFITVWSVNIDGTNLTQVTFEKDRYPSVGYMYALIPR